MRFLEASKNGSFFSGLFEGDHLAHQKGGATVTDVLLGEEGNGDGQRGQEEEKTFYSHGFSPKVMKNGK